MELIVSGVLVLFVTVCLFGFAVFKSVDEGNRIMYFCAGVACLTLGVVLLSVGIEDKIINPSIPIGVEMTVVANYLGFDAEQRIVLQWTNGTDKDELSFQRITVPETQLNYQPAAVGRVLIRLRNGNVISR